MNASRSKPSKWSSEEKKTLLNLIHSKKDILLDSKIKATVKNAAWQEIFVEMKNQLGGKFSQKDVKKVKLKWRRIKDAAQQNLTNYNMRLTQSIFDETKHVCEMFDINTESTNIQEIGPTLRRKSFFNQMRESV